jgi:tetratricopeptide (TPR) repeat protein
VRSRFSLASSGAIACLLGATVLHGAADRFRPVDRAAGAGGVYIRSGEALKRLALSFDALVADLYWIRAVQSFGGARLDGGAATSNDQLSDLLDIATTLDPEFNIAYRAGAIFLAEPRPNGQGNPQAAIALLMKGFRANPRRWQYLHDIGFVYYWWMQDYRLASRWFKRASAVPGAPEWLRPLAGVTLTKGGERAAARALWQRLLDTGDHDYLRRIASYRLAQLHVLDDLDRLNALLVRVRDETGQPASSWALLVRKGWIPRDPPTDPAGVPYVLDRGSGLATVSERSPYAPLPDVTTRAVRPPS